MFEKDLRDMCEMNPTKLARVKEQAQALHKYLEAGGKITQIPTGVSRASLGNETCYRARENNRVRSQKGGTSVRNADKTKLEDL